MYLIRELARKYNLTRSSLLYYDSIGLLSPRGRTQAGYRVYNDGDEKRLANIILFRSMGISLSQIKELLENDHSKLASVLFKRLGHLNQEIAALRNQQKNIINLLKEVGNLKKFIDTLKNRRVNMSLLDGIDPLEWHRRFEEMSPDIHGELLAIIRSIPEEVKKHHLSALASLPEKQRKELNRFIERIH